MTESWPSNGKKIKLKISHPSVIIISQKHSDFLHIILAACEADNWISFTGVEYFAVNLPGGLT